MQVTIFRNLSVSRVNNGRARAPTQRVDVSGCRSFVIVAPCRLRRLRDAAFLRKVSRNEFLGDVSLRLPRLFGETVPFHVELQHPIRRHAVLK